MKCLMLALLMIFLICDLPSHSNASFLGIARKFTQDYQNHSNRVPPAPSPVPATKMNFGNAQNPVKSPNTETCGKEYHLTACVPLVGRGKMVNIERLVSKKIKSRNDASSSHLDKGKSRSSVKRHSSSGLEEGSRPRSHPHSVETSSRPQWEGGLGQSHPKRAKLTIPESVRHGKGKLLCPHLYTINPSNDLWCHPELGADLVSHHIEDVDVAYLGPHSAHELVDSTFCDIATIPAAIQCLGDKARAYEEMRAKAEEYEERSRLLTQELTQLKLDRDTSLKKLEEEISSLRVDLKAEVASGRGFFESLGGQRFMQLHDEGVITAFKGSDEFTEAVEDASISVFDECVAYFQERLINSGRFPGEKFEFLDPTWVELIEGSPLGHSSAAHAS